jgi:hypothetical protein
MIKMATSSPRRFMSARRIPFIKHLVVFFLPAIDGIANESDYESLCAALRYGDVTGKQTAAGRFSDLDPSTLDILADGYSLHDVGISSGITSLELQEQIARRGIQGKFTISDKFVEMYVSDGLVSRVYDAEQQLRNIYIGPFLFDPRLSVYFALSKYLFHLFKLVPSSHSQRPFLLLAPSVLRAVQSNTLNFQSYDVMQPSVHKAYSFVRCMNLLNLSYFSSSEIIRAIGHLRDSLVEGGILLFGRTRMPGVNDATFYQKIDGQLCPIKTVEMGTEIHALVEMGNSSGTTV